MPKPKFEGRERVVIRGVRPEVEGGRFPAKAIEGDAVEVEADIFADGHDRIAAFLLWKREGARRWNEAPMQPLGNDRWRGTFEADRIGRYRYTITAWVEPFETWRHDLEKRLEAGQEISVDLRIGAGHVREAAEGTRGRDRDALLRWAELLEGTDAEAARGAALDPDLAQAMKRNACRRFAETYERTLRLEVERERARFCAWYEVFPRSCASEPGRHGTFGDLESRLPEIAAMGFDIVYLPPIHPIGRSFRKGRNNSLHCEPGDPGSPWAIGSDEGGHKAIHAELGAEEEFRRLVEAARGHGMEIALDIAFHTSPDHPYVKAHPEWFRKRPDGTIQYAENPPKKYQDIYPFNFETDNWRELWEELRSIFEHWIDEGVKIFRVDNPHTKSFHFWEWCIESIRKKHPDVILLSEAFTRPKIMYRLAQLGFSQSYTYFPWRTAKRELTDYFTELTQSPVRDFFRGSHWTNTPDILIEFLQRGGGPAFAIRFVLAATLGANYGMYGPAFELCENRPLREGSEEYLNSEKYEIRGWDVDRPDSLRPLISQVNAIRRANPAFRSDRFLHFHETDNDQLLCYSRRTADRGNVILVVVNLDPKWKQSGWVSLDLHEIGAAGEAPFALKDLLTGTRYEWKGSRNYVELDLGALPAHILAVEPRVSGGPEEAAP